LISSFRRSIVARGVPADDRITDETDADVSGKQRRRETGGALERNVSEVCAREAAEHFHGEMRHVAVAGGTVDDRRSGPSPGCMKSCTL